MSDNNDTVDIDDHTGVESDLFRGYSKYFHLKSKKVNSNNSVNLYFECLLCKPSSKLYSASKTSLTNLKRHIEKIHKYKYKTFLADIEEAKIKNSDHIINSKKRSIDDSSTSQPQLKQVHIDRYRSGKTAPITQKILDNAIVKFVVDEIQLLQIVDKLSFIELVRLGLPKDIKIMCEKTLSIKIEQSVLDMKNDLIEKLSKVSYVATTADAWSNGKRSYLGITVHWIDPKTLSHCNGALACTPQLLFNTYVSFKIQNKVMRTTTDNGRNFVKAFNVFGVDINDTDVCSDEADDSDTEFIELFDILSTSNTYMNDDDFNNIHLPPHFRCASHTKVLAKCQKVWNKQNQSTGVAEFIKEQFNFYLKTPVETRWNAKFDSLQQINNILKNSQGLIKMNEIMDQCELGRLDSNEVQLINEYCEVMEPIASTLDFLQGEKGMYMGFFLPTIYALDKKLDQLGKKKFIIITPLLEALHKCFKKRFDAVSMEKSLVIAACLHPYFKLSWLEGDNKSLAEVWLKSIFECLSRQSDSEIEVESNDDNFENNFFCLPTNHLANSISTDQLQLYLNSNDKEL
ncbi:hypothetical protein QTP88_007503 [Uroleucon formosanum]